MKNNIFLLALLCFIVWSCQSTDITSEASLFEDKESIKGSVLEKNLDISKDKGWDIVVGSAARRYRPNYWDGYEKIGYSAGAIRAFDATNIMKGSESFRLVMPTLPFQEQSFDKLKQVFAVGSKVFKDSLNQDTGFALQYASIFPQEETKNIGGFSFMGNQSGSIFKILAQREVLVTDPASVAQGYAKALEVVIQVSCKLYDHNRKYVGNMQNLRIQLKINHKIFTQ